MVQLLEGQTLLRELDGESTRDRCVDVCCLDDQDISAEWCALG